ncbi:MULTISPECIES: hypothetical protein [unclassified Sphingomonas]|uniref:hypothetical protein n=1 Tax=unclassified Sphingomonas TaxID=196159 RepID=UPI00226A8851|nr:MULTISPECIES: hypothetical protein [unclassified Sphingomonas]
MNLLLLLSALLSALTGAGSVVRGPAAAHAVSATAVCVQAAKAVQVASRPVQALAAVSAVARSAASARPWVLLAVHPLYAGRRRV